MRPAQSVEPAGWITSRLHPFAVDVGSIIPAGFEAYARVFHPPYLHGPDGTQTPIRWQAIADAKGRTIQSELQHSGISCNPSRFSLSGEKLWDEQPRTGSIPFEVAHRLAAILAGHTQTAESCCFAVWEGFGDLRIPRDSGPRISIPGRQLFLLEGTLAEVMSTFSVVAWSYQSPNLWWPEDRAWCVATEIDFAWTYIGGSAACVQEILRDPEFESLPTGTDQGNSMEK